MERLVHSGGRATSALRSADLLDLVGFENVAFLEVVEAGQLDAALDAFADLAGVVLLAPSDSRA